MKSKTFLLLLIVLICTFILSACAQNQDSSGKSDETSAAGSAQTDPSPETPEDYDSVIDASFTAGRLVLTETEIALPDPDTCTVNAPPRRLQLPDGSSYPDEGDIRGALRSGNWNAVVYSPDGRVQIGYLVYGENKEHLPLIIRDGQATMIYPSDSRGAKDTHRGMQDYYSRWYFGSDYAHFSLMPLGIGPDLLTWSPDGRYYFAESYRLAFLYNQSVHYIVDTVTGEMIALDTFTYQYDSALSDNGCIYSGCFSPDSRYFYAACRSDKYTDEWTSCIIRYDLESFEGTLLAETGGYYGGQSMHMLRDGSMLGLFWNGSDQSVFWISPDGNIRSAKEPRTRPSRLIRYSLDSGWAALTDGERLNGQYRTDIIPGPGLQLIRPEDGTSANLDSMLFVNNDTGIPEIGSFAQTWGIQANGNPAYEEVKKYLKFPYQFLDVALSPNGRYVALLLSRRLPKDEVLLMIVRPEDQAYLIAEGLVIDDNPPKNTSFRYPKYYSVRDRKSQDLPILNWTDAGLLVVSGSAHLLQVAEDPLSFPPPEPEEEEVPEGPEVHSTDLFDYIVLEDGTAEITWYGGDVTELVIPSELEGVPVTGIGANAFCGDKIVTEVSGLQKRLKGTGSILVSLEMPETVTSIGDGAFAGCASLTEIEIPAGVKALGSNLFRGCTNLCDIRISPDNPYLEIRDEALFSKDDCRLICYLGVTDGEYAVPEGTLSIGGGAFSEKASLHKVIIPESVTSIGDGAFRSCTQLVDISIPKSVTRIGSHAFEKCRKLASVTLPDSITEMGDNPFLACLKLTDIHVSPSHPYLEVIDGVLFSKPDKRLICYPRALAAKEYTVPDGTVIIGENAFGTVPALKQLFVPSSVTSNLGKVEEDNPGIEIIHLP